VCLTAVDEHGVSVVEGTPEQSVMRRPQDAAVLLEACFAARARAALLYPANLTPRFFDLSSGEAGEILEKLRQFRVRLAIVCAPGAVTVSSRFPEILCDDLQLFDTRDAARHWLAAGR